MTGDVGSPFWWSDSIGDVHVAFTSARTGNLATHIGDPEAALANRADLAQHLGTAPRFLNQVHSAEVLDADTAVESTPTADAWVGTASTALAVLVADCLPVLFAGLDRNRRPVTAAAHAGRQGLLAGILQSTAAAMSARGAQSVTAWVGPGACRRCYEVPEDMLETLARHRPNIASRTSWGTAALNLRAEARTVLESAGVDVVDVPGCTIEDPQLFSHRRSQATGDPQGRFAGVVW